MTLEHIKLAFDKFYQNSPMAGRNLDAAQVRLAMEGSFMGGYIHFAEYLKEEEKKFTQGFAYKAPKP